MGPNASRSWTSPRGSISWPSSWNRPKTAFVSPFRKFQYNRVPFGLSNAPAVFQRAVELVLVDCVKSKRQLRSFLGLCNYYRRFVRDFHRYSSLLSPLTSSGAPRTVEWTPVRVYAFRKLCCCLTTSVCLCIPTEKDSFVIETDGSGSGVGGVLSVVRDESLCPVSFNSKQLQGAERRYSAQELEGLALYLTIVHFAFYLYGRTFTVVTDHRPLVNQKNRRLLRWTLKLEDFDFRVIYR